jgi:hypothetical protein
VLVPDIAWPVTRAVAVSHAFDEDAIKYPERSLDMKTFQRWEIARQVMRRENLASQFWKHQRRLPGIYRLD